MAHTIHYRLNNESKDTAEVEDTAQEEVEPKNKKSLKPF